MMWKSLQMPRSFQKVETGEDGRYAKFVVEALERGWGITLGNALRRTLLSSLQGAAIVSVKIEGVEKEFSTIPGVKEDVTDIILNLKSIRVKLLSDHDETLHLDVSGDGEVTAKDFVDNPNVTILTPDVHIATLNGNASLSMDVKISCGRGYVTADELKDKDAPIGVIAMDANFNPVQKVAMHISDTRVGQRTDFNRLELEITTDGSIDPEDALAYAAKLLVDHLEIFINFEGDLESPEELEMDEERQRIATLLRTRVDELELSVRSSNCLRMANIHTVGELVRNKENDMLKYKNFGRKSLVELNEVLTSMGLSFGHGVKNKKLGVNAQHKRAILRALTTSILEKGMEAEQTARYVRTTLHKAKIVRSNVDRMITYAKKGDLSARREAARFITSPKVLQDLFNTIGPRYASRNGGYTRIIKLGPNRAGDAAEMALIGLVEDEIVAKSKKAAEPAKSEAVSMVEGESKSAN